MNNMTVKTFKPVDPRTKKVVYPSAGRAALKTNSPVALLPLNSGRSNVAIGNGTT